ncbi:MAG: CoA transferase [Acidimicrobiales bacterium]
MLRARIEDYCARAGLALAPTTDIEILGADPVLRSPLHLGEGAATVLGLLGQEAACIGQLRGLPPQRLRVDVRHAAASLHSFLLLQIQGGIVPLLGHRAGAHLTSIFRCRDGRYIHLHGSFDEPAAILRVLGLGGEPDNDAVAEAVARREAGELEDVLALAGLCGAICRSPAEWGRHPQGRALADRPLIEVTRIGEGPPVPFAAAERPLSGIRVLDLTRVLAGPTAARTLAEHGADVLHVAAPHLPTIPLFEIDTGHGKRQAHLDLRRPEDAARLRQLVVGADVFSQGFQHRSLDRRGFGPDELAALRPGIVYVSENAYGQVGPWNDRPGWEQLAQAATGVTVVQGGGRPIQAPAAMNDYTTGYLAALGAMIALRRRASEGGSWHVQTSLARTAMWFLALGADLNPAAATDLGNVATLMDETESGYGRLGFLKPALQMSVTPPRWRLPARPLGSDSPTWIDAPGGPSATP